MSKRSNILIQLYELRRQRMHVCIFAYLHLCMHAMYALLYVCRHRYVARCLPWINVYVFAISEMYFGILFVCWCKWREGAVYLPKFICSSWYTLCTHSRLNGREHLVLFLSVGVRSFLLRSPSHIANAVVDQSGCVLRLRHV